MQRFLVPSRLAEMPGRRRASTEPSQLARALNLFDLTRAHERLSWIDWLPRYRVVDVCNIQHTRFTQATYTQKLCRLAAAVS